jgi:hypothetical protein
MDSIKHIISGIRPCGHGFATPVWAIPNDPESMFETRLPIERIMGLSAPIGPNGMERVNFEAPVLMLRMKGYPEFCSVNTK